MNGRQLQKLGVPQDCVREAITNVELATLYASTDIAHDTKAG